MTFFNGDIYEGEWKDDEYVNNIGGENNFTDYKQKYLKYKLKYLELRKN